MSTEEMLSPECITHIIPENKATNNKLNFAWATGNRLAIFDEFPPRQDAVSVPDECSRLQEVKWDTTIHAPITRKLINESHGVFLSLQNLKGDVMALRPQLVKISHNYRSIIQVCIENLKSTSESTNDELLKEELEAQCQIFYKIELVWNLCEILFINIQPSGVIMCQLLDWIQWHFTEHKQLLTSIVGSPQRSAHPQYWHTLYAHVLQGQMSEARKLLKLHVDIHSDHYQSMDELLRKMPIYTSYAGHSWTEFNLRWTQWHEECVKRYEDGEFNIDDNLNTLARVLCGDKQVFEELRPVIHTWYHLLVSILLFTNPAFKYHELHQLAKECIEMYEGYDGMSHFDHILLSATEFDLQQIIKQCYGCMDQWFVTHLTDLLFHCGETNSDRLTHGPLLRESLLVDYASSLMTHSSLWEIGVDYFDHCQLYGKDYLEAYLERVPLTSHYKATKVYSMAAQRNMNALAFSICKVMGRQALQQGRIGSALTWAIKSKDAPFASFLANKVLSKYAQDEDISGMDILDNLGSSMIISDKLTFVGKYREFHELYKQNEIGAAAELLVSLMSSQIAPKYFWLVLLLDALPLLENEQTVFNSAQTQELMYCFQELTSSWKTSKDKVNSKLLKEKEELIRIALARNLARTFIQEGTNFSS